MRNNLLLLLFVFFSFSPIVELKGQINEIYEEATQLFDSGEYKKAYKKFEKAYEKGYYPALGNLVLYHFEGLPPCDKNVNNGLKLIDEYSKEHRKSGYGYYLLALLYSDGEYVGQDYNRAAMNAQYSCDKGYVLAYSLLGNFYLNGLGVITNEKTAADIFEKGANEGDIESYNYLGEAYLYGKGRPIDYSKAFSYFQRALKENRKEAVNNVGLCYLYGLGTKQNNQKAFEYLQRAVEMGDARAYYHLGMYYFSVKDYTNSFQNLKRAIETGAYTYSIELAYHYANGWGCEQNLAEAHRLIDIGISEEPANMALWNSKGDFYLIEGNKDKALAVWNKMKDSNYALLNADKSVFIKAMNSGDMNIVAETTKEDELVLTSKPIMISDVDKVVKIKSEFNSNTFVVILANENYRREEPVPYANNDGEIFKTYCQNVLGIPEKNIKYIADASLNDLKYNLNWLKQVMEAYAGEAKAIFYYAGHGIPDEAQKTAYLLPVDGYGSDVSTGYKVDELYATLGKLPSKSVTVFLDACFSGSKRDGGILASARGVAIKAKKSNPVGNMVVFSAAQGDETAYPYKEQRHGMFTYYLLKKLQETKGEATLGEISDYVTSEVRKQSIVINGKMQTPTLTSSSAVGDAWRNWKLK